ncbi:chemotaxis protein CheB [Aurantiacibacter poecillastricola]|uniref:chemotaxis protein CheB n=1 Tax=Aurantiacibacter poecillastricola TaxID=3064385 RepID=UPI00273DEF25|nr:chemotaxis protein CheB [Aurantiacibacter sp. 219JJ12-13]MDP5262390.1 response regulator [Aurantiacibacter sp. 219JJ12-13]
MSDIRVLVVDDSAAMRALFSDILDQAKGVEVVGTARSADEARDMIAERKPDVLTLDVEMPGMTGMEFLEELMSTNPIPVIMLSSVTQEGTGTAQKALALGAVDCFPKPLHTSQEEFSATVAKLGSIVLAAAANGPGNATNNSSACASDYESDGRMVALAAAALSLEVMRETIAAFPANCPPTIILVDADPAEVERAVDRLRPSVACEIKGIEGDEMLSPGTVYLAYDKSRHIVVENDFALLAKAIERDPVGGHRPSADLLFASMARTGLGAVAGLLAGPGSDGVRGLEALAKSGALVFAQQPDSICAHQRHDDLRKSVSDAASVGKASIGEFILEKTSKTKLAA